MIKVYIHHSILTDNEGFLAFFVTLVKWAMINPCWASYINQGISWLGNRLEPPSLLMAVFPAFYVVDIAQCGPKRYIVDHF
jgi:hypothetical protein